MVLLAVKANVVPLSILVPENTIDRPLTGIGYIIHPLS